MEPGGSRSRYFLIGRGVWCGVGVDFQKYRCTTTREVRRPREVDSSGIFSFFSRGPTVHSPGTEIFFSIKKAMCQGGLAALWVGLRKGQVGISIWFQNSESEKYICYKFFAQIRARAPGIPTSFQNSPNSLIQIIRCNHYQHQMGTFIILYCNIFHFEQSINDKNYTFANK